MLFGLVAGTVTLTEAGKKIAARNAARIKAAIAAMQEMLGEVEPEEDVDATEAGRQLAEAMLRKSDTLDARREGIRRAIQEKLTDPLRPDRPWVWIKDVFDDAVVCEGDEGGALTKYPYSIDATVEPPRYIIGEGTPVQLAYVPVPGALDESAALDEDFVALSEGAVRKDGTATIKLITPGWGSSGYYPADVLERDGPKVFLEGTKMFADHPTAAEEAARPERSIKDLAAVLTSPGRWQAAGPDGPGLYAEAKVYEAWRKPLDEMAADTGVSIRALGRARMGEAEGRKGPIVEAIASAKSVDFVTSAGRGGRIVPLAEAARINATQGPSPISGGTPAKEDHMPLTEAEQARIQTLEESVRTLTTTAEGLAAANRALVESALRSEARTQATGILASINLPAASKARLVESLGATPPVKDGALDRAAFEVVVREAAKSEGTYIAALTGGGGIKGMGETLQEAEAPDAEALNATLTEAFAGLGMGESAAKVAAAGR